MSSKEYTKPTILVVDDVPANLEVITSSLGSKSYSISIARNGAAALDRARTIRPQLILLDIQMPGMDGYQVCQHLKEDSQTSSIPIIFMTALNEMEDKIRAFQLGAVDYITKPIERQELIARVNTHISLHNTQKELQEKNAILEANALKQKRVEQILRHDLKSPLQGILAIPELLLLDSNLDDKQRELLTMLGDLTNQVLHITNSSLMLYKMENGTYRLNPQEVDIIAQLKKANLSLHTVGHDLLFRIMLNGSEAVHEEKTIVIGEESLFFSLFSNLLKNAREASPEGSLITAEIHDQADHVEISVTNLGSVPLEIRDRFFDEFATSGKELGTGLGTYSARLITSTLGGTIALDCSVEDQTTILLNFPK